MFLLIFDYPPLFMGPGYTYFVVLFRCNTTLWYFTATFSFPVTSKSAVANGRQKNILPIWNPARWRKPLCLVLKRCIFVLDITQEKTHPFGDVLPIYIGKVGMRKFRTIFPRFQEKLGMALSMARKGSRNS